MRHRFPAVAFIASVLLSGAAFARGEQLQNIPLKWSPTSTFSEMGAIDVSGGVLTTSIHFETFADTRQNPALVAENREKADPRPVTTSSDVAAFVTDHFKESLHGAGLNIVDTAADITVSGEIRQFFVAETSLYKGEISLLIHVKNSSGKELWTGIVGGDAERFGRSYRADNYFETMSDMLLRASYNLLASAGFRETLQKH